MTDFVVLWVDGSDPAWLAEKNHYSPKTESAVGSDGTEVRFRDWNQLRYWFRAVAEFAPWVGRIHFVTWGHIPQWLDTECSKLNIVKHSDYLPEEYRPTFSANPIELNLHRIAGLSEKFVFFNDDMFLGAPVSEADFFDAEGKPRLLFELNRVVSNDYGDVMPHILINDMAVVNNQLKQTGKSLPKASLLDPRQGLKTLLRDLSLLLYPGISALTFPHLPVAMTKSSMKEVWDAHFEILDATSRRKIRDMRDVNQYVFHAWNLIHGNYALNMPNNKGKVFFDIQARVTEICKVIETSKYELLCINDSASIDSFENLRDTIISAFDRRFPQKCFYERT